MEASRSTSIDTLQMNTRWPKFHVPNILIFQYSTLLQYSNVPFWVGGSARQIEVFGFRMCRLIYYLVFSSTLTFHCGCFHFRLLQLLRVWQSASTDGSRNWWRDSNYKVNGRGLWTWYLRPYHVPGIASPFRAGCANNNDHEDPQANWHVNLLRLSRRSHLESILGTSHRLNCLNAIGMSMLPAVRTWGQLG